MRHYLPQFRVRDDEVSQRVEVRHLLTHVAGWTGDVFTDTGNNDEAMQQYVDGMAEFEQLRRWISPSHTIMPPSQLPGGSLKR